MKDERPRDVMAEIAERFQTGRVDAATVKACLDRPAVRIEESRWRSVDGSRFEGTGSEIDAKLAEFHRKMDEAAFSLSEKLRAVALRTWEMVGRLDRIEAEAKREFGTLRAAIESAHGAASEDAPADGRNRRRRERAGSDQAAPDTVVGC